MSNRLKNEKSPYLLQHGDNPVDWYPWCEEALKKAERMAEETLNAIAKGGIHDHIGGGFSRYSTDEKWLVPHFEKMLYDNGLLILAYLKAYQITGKEDYEKIVCSTADYILRELADEKGGFYCGQDADSDGVEGKYYSFTPKEVLSVLGKEDGEEFCRLYGIAQGGNFEGKSIPNRIGQAHIGWQADDMRLRKLYDYRMKRTKLHKDKKCLLSWNAWTILALARAGWILSKERYLDGAFEGEAFIKEHMKDEKGRLYLRFCEGEAAHQAQLEDYGVYALAMLKAFSPKKELICAVNGKMPQEVMESLKEKPQDEWHVLVKNAENAEILSECAPFTKNYPIPESGAVYYLCENGVCRAPVTDFKQLGL